MKMGTPWFQMQDLVRKHGIIGLSSNYTLYGDMSNRIMAILRTYSPNVEVYSIDESFLNLTGMQGIWASPTDMGQDIRKRILCWTSLPVCGSWKLKDTGEACKFCCKEECLTARHTIPLRCCQGLNLPKATRNILSRPGKDLTTAQRGRIFQSFWH